MNNRLRIAGRILLVVVTALLGFRSPLLAEEPKPDDLYYREFWTDASVFSLIPGEELATFHSNSSGGLEPGATLGLGIQNKQREFEVTIVAKLKGRRFMANVIVKPTAEDTRTRAQEIEYDLSDLNPQSLEIARDEDGRVYRLSLVPRIIEHPKPKQFKVSDLRLESWSFPSSTVILNDQDYLGRLSMSYGSIASCDIPGLANVEFSLLHLKDAAALGTLTNGVINIAHDSTTVRISDVKNGLNAEILEGGPYQVWVRWKKPTQSVEEFHESWKVQIAAVKERIESGDLSIHPETLKRLEKMIDSGRIGEINCSVRQAEPDELVDPE